ncbi:hypothetical protein AB2B38_001105 [Balneola sp. MJW-20]|uniref:hypothetical protein n=1 Tax=Gracilimonas aurantiaca TaxID=3234185 RepID=UPI0034656D6E
MFKYIFTLALGVLVYFTYTNLPVKQGPGIKAEYSPTIKLLKWQKPFSFKEVTLTPRKEFGAEVRVIRKKNYYFDDFKEYSPTDLLVGWKDLSNGDVLGRFHAEITDRNYEFDLTTPPVPVSQLHDQTDLWHIIPSSDSISDKLNEIREGHIIKISGLLVDVSNDNGMIRSTNISLDQQKKYSSFIVWVEELEIK